MSAPYTVYNIEYRIGENRWMCLRLNYESLEKTLESAKEAGYREFRITRTIMDEEIYHEVHD